MTVEQFFTRYAALSMGDDDRAMAAVYAPSFFVAGPTGSMMFANDARFLDWLAQVRVFNRQHGMRGLTPAAVQKTVLSPLPARTRVRVGARSGGGDAGARVVVKSRTLWARRLAQG